MERESSDRLKMFVNWFSISMSLPKISTNKLVAGETSRVFEMKISFAFLVLQHLFVVSNYCEASLITNINSAFDVFSVKSLIRFFEFNDVGWNFTQSCFRDMYLYLDGLQKDYRWSYKCK
jgi:hypothetical protein